MGFEPRELAGDGRKVQAIGIGGGYGPSPRALDMAFERGVNYYFFAPTFPTYVRMMRWLRGRFRTDREKIILGTAPYFWKLPGSLDRSLSRYRRWLGTDYIDYFHLGMIRSSDSRAMEDLMRFKDEGMIRHIAISCHNRRLAARLARKWPLELVMMRYNAANRGGEEDFFPSIDTSKIPVVAFNATRHRSLLKAPRGWSHERGVPKAADCYRFALTNPGVTMCLAGPSKVEHMEGVFEALDKGPMDEDEMKWMREFGDRVYGRRT